MKKVVICDSSLKTIGLDGTNILSFKEKLEIAKRLSELNVDVIEVSPVKNDKADEVLIKTACNCALKPIISCIAGSSAEEVEKNYALIAGAKRKRLNVIMPVSPVQMEYLVSKKPALVLEQLKAITLKAASLESDVEVSLVDATRAETEFLYSAIKTAISCGAKTVSLIDIAGTMLLDEFSAFIKDVFANVPELKGVDLIVGASDVLSMGVANSFAALKAGANGIKVASLKTDNVPSIVKFAAAMENIGLKQGLDTGLNKTALKRIAGKISEIATINGEKRQVKESDEKAETLAKDLTSAALAKIIKKRGYELSPEDNKKVYNEFVRLSGKKDVNTKELDAIIAANALQVPETYSLVNFSVNTSNVLSATASITLCKDGESISGLSYGNGPVDAAFLAIEAITKRHIELDDFDLSAITEGKEAMGQAIVKLRYNGVIYSGRGISTDIIGASIRAYLGAINKIVYEESK
ncbi:MAG: hypothetical protein J5911_04570 [Clostridia bacterium]|nr:hypothetical protein [Clostridia bacterium]